MCAVTVISKILDEPSNLLASNLWFSVWTTATLVSVQLVRRRDQSFGGKWTRLQETQPPEGQPDPGKRQQTAHSHTHMYHRCSTHNDTRVHTHT